MDERSIQESERLRQFVLENATLPDRDTRLVPDPTRPDSAAQTMRPMTSEFGLQASPHDVRFSEPDLRFTLEAFDSVVRSEGQPSSTGNNYVFDIFRTHL